MNKDTFLKELEYLLQDLDGEETEDAIGYYRDYFEEAGPENEETVLRELGSPERIAAMIRADLRGDLGEGGEFTDRGYEDQRFRDPGYQVARRFDLPETREPLGEHQQETKAEREPVRQKRNRVLTVILFAFLAVLALPVFLGIGSGVFGIAAALVSLLFALILGIASVTLGLLLGGIVMAVIGIVVMTGQFSLGLLLLGLGVLVLGLGLLGVALSLWFYGKALPALVRWAVNMIRRMFAGRRERSNG